MVRAVLALPVRVLLVRVLPVLQVPKRRSK